MSAAEELLRIPPSVAAHARAQTAFDDLYIVLPTMDDRVSDLLRKRPPDNNSSPPSAAEAARIEAYAEQLADVLLSDGIVLHDFAKALHATQARKARLRVWLQCPSTDLEVAEVPWELARLSAVQRDLCQAAGAHVDDDDRYLALHPDLALVRTFNGAALSDTFFDSTSAREPIRVLVAIAATAEVGAGNVGSADVQRTSVERILAEEAPGLFAEPKILEYATPATLEAVVAEYAPHVVQLICHGGKGDVASGGAVSFRLCAEGRPNATVNYPVQSFAEVCGKHGVKVVVLSVCWSGQAYPLIQQVPVVVGMQFRLSDANAAEMIDRLYESLVQGLPFEFGVHWARKAFEHPDHEGHPYSFAVPVIYSATRRTTLIHNRQVAADPFIGLIRYYRRGFVGREWAVKKIQGYFSEVDDGVSQTHSDRPKVAGQICLVTAQGGWGKSALMARLIDEVGVAARVFYRYGENQDPLACVLRLLTVIAQRYPEVWAQIERETEPSSDPYFDACERLELALAQVGRLVMVIDGLDECSDFGRALPFTGRPLPAGVAVVASARPEWYADWQRRTGARDVVPLFHIDLEAPEFAPMSSEDTRRYALARLDVTGIVAKTKQELAAKFCELFAGRFLEISIVLASLRRSTPATEVRGWLNDLESAVGQGGDPLQNAWQAYWNRWAAKSDFASIADGCEDAMRVLSTAKGWASEQQLADLCPGAEPLNATSEDADDAYFAARTWVKPYRRFLATDLFTDTLEVRVRIVHESLNAFFVARPKDKKLPPDWVSYCTNWASLQGYARWYGLRFLPEHLLDTGPRREKKDGQDDVIIPPPSGVVCRAGELPDLLFDYEFLSNAIAAVPPRWLVPPRKAVELLDYYDAARHHSDSSEMHEALQLVGNCLSQAADILDEAPEELPSQLYGRLGSPDGEALEGAE